jgi:hypothetical protein
VGARDQFLRIGYVSGRDRIHDFGGRVAKHPLGADIENLDDTFGIGGDAGEVGAVEDRALQRPGLEQSLFSLFPRSVVSADQQISDDGVLRVAQRRDGHDRGKPASVLTDVGQLIDIFDPARGLEHQGFKARRDVSRQFGAQRAGARDQFLRIGYVSGGDRIHDFGGRVAKHALSADIEDLDNALRVGRDAGEVRAVKDSALQSSGFNDRLFRLAARDGVTDPGGPVLRAPFCL